MEKRASAQRASARRHVQRLPHHMPAPLRSCAATAHGAAGLRVLRCSWEQVHWMPEAVRDDLLAALAC